MWKRLLERDEGASLVLTVITIFALVGVAALAIDGGLAYLDVRGSTNAADDAAMAAAQQECSPDTSGETPEQKALAVAAENGYSSGVAYTFNDPVHEVVITTQSGGALGPATNIAPDSIEVIAASAATCEGSVFLDGYAIFGGSDSCGPTEVSLSGASSEINGGVHSNESLHITGAGQSVNGTISYLGGCVGCGSIGGSHSEVVLSPPALPYPEPAGSLNINEFYSLATGVVDFSTTPMPSQPQVTGTYDVYNFGSSNVGIAELDTAGIADAVTNTITGDGIVITTGDITMPPGTSVSGGAQVTFVAGEQIDFKSGDYVGYFGRNDGFGPGLLGYANGGGGTPSCTSKDIKTAASGFTYQGVMYAPYGEIDISTADNSSNSGSLIGYRVTISASSTTISFATGTDDPGGYELKLLGTP